MFGLLSAGGIVAYLKHCEADSDVLMWYFKFKIDDRRAFVLGFSVFVLVFLHRLAAKAGTEVRCRVVGGGADNDKAGVSCRRSDVAWYLFFALGRRVTIPVRAVQRL